MDERANPLSGRLIIGIALVVLGALWTLDNLGLANAGQILRWWPVLPLAVGIMKVTGWGMERQPGFGTFLVIVSTLLMLGELDLLHVSFSIIWPLLFIFMGVQITLRSLRRGADGEGAQADSDDYVRSFAIMGSVTRRNESQVFRGGELTAVMGGVQLDLDNAKPEGGRAVIDVFAIWGGIEVRVPDDWRVEVEATPVMAGVESNARMAPGVEPVGTLVVRGFVMMGGVEIKNTPLNDVRSGVVVRTGRIRRRDRGEDDDSREGRVIRQEVRVGLGGIEVKKESAPPTPPQPPVEPS